MKTLYLILLLVSMFSFQSYACNTSATVEISGPSSVRVGNDETFTLTKTSGTNFQTPPETFTYAPIRVLWEIINSSGTTVVSESQTIAFSNYNGPYENNLDLSGLSTGTYTAKATLRWCEYFPTVAEGCDPKSATDSYTFEIFAAPDLVVDGQLLGGLQFNENSNITLEYAVFNDEDPLSGSVTADVDVWWSLDNNIDPNQDQLAAALTGVNVQASGGNINVSTATITTPSVPNGFVNEVYSLILEVDPDNDIDESQVQNGENNNLFFITDIFILDTSGSRVESNSKTLKGQSITDNINNYDNNNKLGILKVMDIYGKVIWEKSANLEIDISQLPQDKVLIVVYDEKQSISTKKILLTK
ncbi:MAG: hypothetical protein AAF843_18100 [Bacteroidota bacterium]